MQAPDAPIDAWSRLWRAGVLHSCACGIPGNYDGPIAEFWESCHARLRDGDQVVDIGTGNGALLLLAKEHARRRNLCLDLHGVDAADIDPPRSVAGNHGIFDGIRFHPRTSAERLPFESGSVRLLTSQYAFEYMSHAPVFAEIVRVLSSDGTAAFVLHSRDSLVCKVSTEQLEACRFLFSQSDIHARAADVIQMIAGTSHAPGRERILADPRAETVRLAFNASAQALMDAVARWPRAEVLQRAVQVVSQTLQQAAADPATARSSLDRAFASLEAEFVRLRHLDAAILDVDAIERLGARFRDAGFGSVAVAPMDQRAGARMGWTLVASRG
jgi:ubiquinone/menaquinone biosynthesis C-methylase UbiE